MKLEFKNVKKSYGKKEVLKGINLELSEGVYGLLGPNGAGKSTLMNLLTDNIKRDSGEILYDGEEILELGAKFREKIGYMPQQQGMYDGFTAREFLYYVASLKGIKKKDAIEQVAEILKMVNLTDEAHRKVGDFSGGMKQRVLLGQALLGNPDILILDEPTAGLDPKERINTRRFIEEIAKSKIVILATHVVSDVESISKMIMLMKNGEIIKMDTVTNLIDEIWEKEEKSKERRKMNLEDVYMYYMENERKIILE